MASGAEVPVGKAAAKATTKLINSVRTWQYRQRLRRDARPFISPSVTSRLLHELTDDEASRLDEYLDSPDLEEIAVQLAVARMLRDEKEDEVRAVVREQIRQGLRNFVQLSPGFATPLSDAIYEGVVVATQKIPLSDVGARHLGDEVTAAVLGQLALQGARNGALLRDIGDIAECRRFAVRLRSQVANLHDGIRMPHLGVRRIVSYEEIHVRPRLVGQAFGEVGADEIVSKAHRVVVLGDPGAGKSTLAAKMAYDIAVDHIDTLKKRVPFLVILKSFIASFTAGGRSILQYLEDLCRDPYNLEPLEKSIEYLLRNGRAVVIFDGLDELGDPALRARVVQLVEGFSYEYPLVPIMVTSRRIGYDAAPLDSDAYAVFGLEPFSDEQVAAYTAKWFALEEYSATLADSFMRESAIASDIRRNPLMLALLCAMYSMQNYIPRNLAQVYERCALMLFEQWDDFRGIKLPMRFQGHLRGAVQYLAWKQLTDQAVGTATPAKKIHRLIAGYLNHKGIDQDTSDEMAGGFLDFCTGRPWVLAELGSTILEPRYGFSHRSFLEYFAAEYIVRTHRNGESLWAEIEPHVVGGSWELVGQIALQLFDRNVDDGAEEVLQALLHSGQVQSGQTRIAAATFAARSLAHVTITPRLSVPLVDEAIRCCGRSSRSFRFTVSDSSSWSDPGCYGPLMEIINRSSETNTRHVQDAIVQCLVAGLSERREFCGYLVRQFYALGFNPSGFPRSDWEAVRGQMALLVEGMRGDPLWRDALGYLASHPDPASFYRGELFFDTHDSPIALASISPDDAEVEVRGIPAPKQIRTSLLGSPVPWIRKSEWNSTIRSESTDSWKLLARRVRWPRAQSKRSDVAIIILPYLEEAAGQAQGPSGFFRPSSPEFKQMIRNRRRRVSEITPQFDGLDSEALEFIKGWCRGEISVLG